jgi:hypothetical protein
MVTIDILKCIVDEVNIHDCDINEFRNFFNVKEANYTYYTRSINFTSGSDKERSENDRYTKANLVERSACYVTDEECKKKGWTWRPTWSTVYTTKPWVKLKPGDVFDGELVMEVDIENRVVVARNWQVRTKIRMYYIDNPDSKPSTLSDPSVRRRGGYDPYDETF